MHDKHTCQHNLTFTIKKNIFAPTFCSAPIFTKRKVLHTELFVKRMMKML